jgi:CheY-like chemotaxis protein
MPPSILIIDDETLMQLLYKSHIEKAGYRLLAAHSAEEGLAIIQAEKPVLVLMDVILNGEDGLAALRKLKANPETKGIPVIIYTATVSEAYSATRKEAAAAGASGFLTKPISPAQLVKEIKALAPIEAL